MPDNELPAVVQDEEGIIRQTKERSLGENIAEWRNACLFAPADRKLRAGIRRAK